MSLGSSSVESIGLPLHVSLEPDATQILTPAPRYEGVVTTRQEQAVSAINRDVVELVGRQKVALNDVLEENQRLQIRYNNLVGTYETWQKQVHLEAEKELAQKLARMRDELGTKYDAALAERTRQFSSETLKLRAEDEKLHQELLKANDAHMKTLAKQLEEQRRSQRCVLSLAFVALCIVLWLAYLLASQSVSFRNLEAEHRGLQSDFQMLRRQAVENHSYLAGNGVRSALIKLLKPNLPHAELNVRA